MWHAVQLLSSPGPFTLFLPLDDGFQETFSAETLARLVARLELLANSSKAASSTFAAFGFPALKSLSQEPGASRLQKLLAEQQALPPLAQAAEADLATEKLTRFVKAHVFPDSWLLQKLLTRVRKGSSAWRNMRGPLGKTKSSGLAGRSRVFSEGGGRTRRDVERGRCSSV